MEKTIKNETLEEYSKLPLTNNFMFCKVMSNAELCKEFLEILLKIKIDRIEYINSEQQMNVAVGLKSVRLDVFVEDEKRVFDIEMQMVDTKELPKRARFYQSMMDMNKFNKGMLYMELKESFVIFLMPEDSFKASLPCYTFENICRENPKIKLDDKTTKIFYNFNEYAKEKDEEIKSILKYFADGEKSGGITDKMQELLDEARNNSIWCSDYIMYEHFRRCMQYEAHEKGMKEGREEGRKAGREEGRKEKAIETAKNFLRMGLSAEQVAQGTGLSLEQVMDLG